MSIVADLKFGTQKEEELITVLSEAFGVNLVKQKRGAIIDFESDTIGVELKSRNNTYKKYPTTLIPTNKIDYINKTEGNKKYIFAFAFTDGLYYIEYDKEKFSSFDYKMFVRHKRCDYNDKEKLYCYIPISELVKI